MMQYTWESDKSYETKKIQTEWGGDMIAGVGMRWVTVLIWQDDTRTKTLKDIRKFYPSKYIMERASGRRNSQQ